MGLTGQPIRELEFPIDPVFTPVPWPGQETSEPVSTPPVEAPAGPVVVPEPVPTTPEEPVVVPETEPEPFTAPAQPEREIEVNPEENPFVFPTPTRKEEEVEAPVEEPVPAGR